MPSSMRPRIKVLFMSEDLDFSRAFTTLAAASGIEVITKRTLADLGSIGYLGDCDVLLADTLIGPLQGREIAEYARAFFPGLPVLLAADETTNAQGVGLPKAAVDVFCKSSPLTNLVSRVNSLAKAGIIARSQPLPVDGNLAEAN